MTREANGLAIREGDWYTLPRPFRNSCGNRANRMNVRQRKFVGILLVLAVLVGYAVLAVSLGDVLIGDASTTVQLIYFAVAGLLWVVPAGLVIRWMQRPDPGDED